MVNKYARYKIDATGSFWFEYAVYKNVFRVFGLTLWWKVFESDSITMCRNYVSDALKLPEYH